MVVSLCGFNIKVAGMKSIHTLELLTSDLDICNLAMCMRLFVDDEGKGRWIAAHG